MSDDRDVGKDIIKAMQEALAWSKGGGTKAKVTQYECSQCGDEVQITKEVCRDELPLVCTKCEERKLR